MSAFEDWQLALLIVACVLVFVVGLIWIVKLWSKLAYQCLLKSPQTHCDIDSFVNVTNNPIATTKVVLTTKLVSIGNRKASTQPIPLQVIPSPHVKGLYVTRKLTTSSGLEEATTTSNASSTAAGTTTADGSMPLERLLSQEAKKNTKPIVIATIRMGFGHHRLAYSAASWALQQSSNNSNSSSTSSRKVIFHDLLSIPSPEAELIKSTDEWYSKFSRWASEMGGMVERLWGSAMLTGDANALRMAAITAAHLQPLLLAFPKDTPLITTHQLVALTASACGFTNVINLVVDNHPQWFLVVPNTINLVQGFVNYQSFLHMGVSHNELKWGGHWCPYDMVSNIDVDCTARITRRRDNTPLRLLIPVGGAGAQRKFILQFLNALIPLIHDKKVQVLLNAGDHVHMKQAFLQLLDEANVPFDMVTDSAGVYEFQSKYLLSNTTATIPNGVTLFAFEEYFPAVATTDLLCRVADVLCCKPSELAFYCIPKLHIRRVGDHEADSAKRSSELGDGTIEAREVDDAIQFCQLFESTDLLTVMNQAIINNNQIGTYNGCKTAVELALQRDAQAK